MTENKIKPLQFAVSGRITSLLGADSVSDKFVGINEIVKNAYDADATKVTIEFVDLKTSRAKIIITDNGSGISLYDLENNWMVIGTDNKIETPYTAKYERRKIGQKGSGRFALQNLSKKTLLVSYPKKTDGIELEIDWTEFEKEDVLVNEVKHPCRHVKKSKSKTGLRLELSELNDKWYEKDIEKLEDNLTMLIPPDFTSNNFTIDIKAKDYGKFNTDLEQFFFKKAAFVLTANLDSNNKAKYSLKHKRHKKNETKTLSSLSCGPVEFKMFFYYRNDKMSNLGINIDIKKLKKFLDQYGGIKLYRDNIRITGFGEPGNDWLLLDAGRVNDPGKFAGNNQVLGYAKITAEDNPRLVDTTTREGIIGGRAFEDLKIFLRDALSFFAQNREGMIESTHATKKQKTATSKASTQKSTGNTNRNKSKSKKQFLEYKDKYPYSVYDRLEDEVNLCYDYKLPNSCLMLCRKIIENLTYEILYQKFPKDVDLRYDQNAKRSHPFNILVRNLNKKKNKFEVDDRKKIEYLSSLIGKFRQDANRTSHDIMTYLTARNQLHDLRISQIIDIQIYLLDNIDKS